MKGAEEEGTGTGLIRRVMVILAGTVAVAMLVGSVYPGVPHECMQVEEEGCDDPNEILTCLVDPGHQTGFSYWPYEEPPQGAQCKEECPDAHCHHGSGSGSEEQQEDKDDAPDQYQDWMAGLKESLVQAIQRDDSGVVARIVRSEPEVTINPDRRAVQVVSACASDLVIAHYPVAAAHLVQIQAENDQWFAGVLSALSALNRRGLFAAKTFLD